MPTSPTPAPPDPPPAAIALAFDGLAGTESPVSPALPRLLELLARHDLDATFFVEAGVAAAEPFALSMIRSGRHEAAPIVRGGGAVAPIDDVRGVRLARGAAWPGDDGVRDLGLSYVAAEDRVLDTRLAQVTLDAGLADAARGAPQVWHPALQVAVGRALQRRAATVLPLIPAALERGDALGAFAELLDLLAGLRRAGTADVTTVAGLVSSPSGAA